MRNHESYLLLASQIELSNITQQRLSVNLYANFGKSHVQLEIFYKLWFIIKIIVKQTNPPLSSQVRYKSTSRRYTEEGAYMAVKVNWNTVHSLMEPPLVGAKFIITRARAKQLYEILKTEFPTESKKIAPAIKREIEQGNHDTHICFYVDDNDGDSYIALQCASMHLIFNTMDYYDHRPTTDEKPFKGKECSVCPYCDPERNNCSHRHEVC